MKRCVYLIVCSLIAGPTFVFAQLSYIVIDTSRHGGINVVEGTIRDNCRFIGVKTRKEGPTTTYLPGELDEYGLKDGTVYCTTMQARTIGPFTLSRKTPALLNFQSVNISNSIDQIQPLKPYHLNVLTASLTRN